MPSKVAPSVRQTSRDMSSDTFASKMLKGNAAEMDDYSDVEDDFPDEPDANKDGEELDSDELEDEDDGSETVDDFQGAAFDIGRTVNLESGDLALRKTHQCPL
jgi:hypothetical protein